MGLSWDPMSARLAVLEMPPLEESGEAEEDEGARLFRAVREKSNPVRESSNRDRRACSQMCTVDMCESRTSFNLDKTNLHTDRSDFGIQSRQKCVLNHQVQFSTLSLDKNSK